MTTKKTNAFDPALLKAPTTERVDSFVNYRVDHPHLKHAHSEALNAIGQATGARVMLIAGPTGVGKSTMARRLYKDLQARYADAANRDKGCVPVMGISAAAPNGQAFSWKDFYIRVLERHGDVLTDRKLHVPRQHELFTDSPLHSPLERSAADALCRSLENTLRQRRTKVLIIDEAHHILMVKDTYWMERQFEILKSLTINGDVTIVLVGTYRLLNIREQSGQLVRRSKIIHFPRYDFRVKEQRAIFASVFASFLHRIPLPTRPALENDLEYFYCKTGGCTGILKDWLARCTEQAIDEGRKTFDRKFADLHALDNKSLRTIISEAMEGEEQMEDESLDSIEHLLKNGIGSTGIVVPNSGRPRAKPSNRKVGERLPFRDPVGGVRHVATGA